MFKSLIISTSIVLSLGFSACQLDDDIARLNHAPEITINNKKQVVDSIKTSPNGSMDKTMALRLWDRDRNISRLQVYNSTFERLAFGDQVASSQQILANPSFTNFTTKGVGQAKLVLYDEFDRADSAELKTVAFDNLPPVAQATMLPNGSCSNLCYSINASSSYDQDARWGGRVVAYKIEIVGQNIPVFKPEPFLDYAFFTTGTYTVRITVRDNDNAIDTLMRTLVVQ